MNLLLDTCVVIDYLGAKDPYCVDATRVIAAGFFGDARLWVSAGSIKDAHYVLSKYVRRDKVEEAIGAFLGAVEVCTLSRADIDWALAAGWSDFEDALIAAAADAAACDYIITRDLTGFKKSRTPAMAPAQWLDLQAQAGITYEELS